MCFVDDLLLFCQGKICSVQPLLDAFKKFSGLTGQVANLQKSSVYFGGVTEGEQQVILRASGFVKGTFPLRYLGIPLSPKRWSKLECFEVVQKLTSRISCWYATHLSYAGRMLLVQSVLHSLHSYWSSIFVLPMSILDGVDRCWRSFLWGKRTNGSANALVNWHLVCSSKKQGELGLRESRWWNMALIGRQIWDL